MFTGKEETHQRKKKITKICLEAQYIFHRNKYITIIGTIIWQQLYTEPFTIKKISGNGDANALAHLR